MPPRRRTASGIRRALDKHAKRTADLRYSIVGSPVGSAHVFHTRPGCEFEELATLSTPGRAPPPGQEVLVASPGGGYRDVVQFAPPPGGGGSFPIRRETVIISGPAEAPAVPVDWIAIEKLNGTDVKIGEYAGAGFVAELVASATLSGANQTAAVIGQRTTLITGSELVADYSVAIFTTDDVDGVDWRLNVIDVDTGGVDSHTFVAKFAQPGSSIKGLGGLEWYDGKLYVMVLQRGTGGGGEGSATRQTELYECEADLSVVTLVSTTDTEVHASGNRHTTWTRLGDEVHAIRRNSGGSIVGIDTIPLNGDPATFGDSRAMVGTETANNTSSARPWGAAGDGTYTYWFESGTGAQDSTYARLAATGSAASLAWPSGYTDRSNLGFKLAPGGGYGCWGWQSVLDVFGPVGHLAADADGAFPIGVSPAPIVFPGAGMNPHLMLAK